MVPVKRLGIRAKWHKFIGDSGFGEICVSRERLTFGSFERNL